MKLTDVDRKKLEEVYIGSLKEGFQTCTGLIKHNGEWIPSDEYWDKALRENFEGQLLEDLLDKFIRKRDFKFIEK